MTGNYLLWKPRMFISSVLLAHILDIVIELFSLLTSSPVKEVKFSSILLIDGRDLVLAFVNSNTPSAYIRCLVEVEPFTWYVSYWFFWVKFAQSWKHIHNQIKKMGESESPSLSPSGLWKVESVFPLLALKRMLRIYSCRLFYKNVGRNPLPPR